MDHRGFLLYRVGMNDAFEPKGIEECLVAVGRGEISVAAALGLHPRVLANMLERAAAMVDGGKHDEGERRLRDLGLVLNNSPIPMHLMGLSRMKRGAYHEAVDAFDEAVRRARIIGDRDQELQTRSRRAEALIQIGCTCQALEDWKEIVAHGQGALVSNAQRARERLGDDASS